MTVTEQGDQSGLVAALRAVPGVADAGVEPDGEGGLGLLRLALAPDVDEVEVATAVGSLLRRQFGIGVDVDRVQVVEDADAGALAAVVPAQRPAISRMHLVSSGLDVTATVTLAAAGRSADGEARGTASPGGVQRAVAAATLRAVEQLLDGAVRVELEHLQVSRLGSERTVLVTLTLLTARGTERLTGAAAVREDVRQAVMRATLDALNRRLETLLA